MEVKKLYSYIFADTLISDVFLSEYLPLLDSNAVKTYIYMLYVSKKGKTFSNVSELSSVINIDKSIVEETLKELTEKGLLSYIKNSYIINDLKEKEINKLYTRKEHTRPSDIDELTINRKERNKTFDAINNMFFKGVMPPSWYTKIDMMYEKYKFEHDVMLQLFQQCHENNALNPNYVNKVAQSWSDKGIKNNFDLDKYLIAKDTIYKLASYIGKKLKLMRMLTDYELEIVEKWHIRYNFSRDIIDLALQKTTSTTKPSFKYIDAILTNWFDSGLCDVAKIKDSDIQNKKSSYSKKSDKGFSERSYNEKDIEDLYFDPSKEKEDKF